MAAHAQVAMGVNWMAMCYANVSTDPTICGATNTDRRRILREKEGRRLNTACGDYCANFNSIAGNAEVVCMEYLCGVDTNGQTCVDRLGGQPWGDSQDGMLDDAEAWFSEPG